jgi:hypothetical protein
MTTTTTTTTTSDTVSSRQLEGAIQVVTTTAEDAQKSHALILRLDANRATGTSRARLDEGTEENEEETAPERGDGAGVAASSLSAMTGAATVTVSSAWAFQDSGVEEERWTADFIQQQPASTPSSSSPPSLLPRSALQDRIDNNVLAQPTYGMDGPDVFYPPYVAC